MIIKDFDPSYLVKDYVQCYRIINFVFKQNEIPVKFYPPKPENCLHFFMAGYISISNAPGRKEIYDQPVVTGLQTTALQRVTGKNFFNFQIVFQPNAIYRLLGIPAGELTDKHIAASDIFSYPVKQLNDSLNVANSFEQMLTLADNFIISLIKKEKPRSHGTDKVISDILVRENNFSVKEIANEVFLSTKQFKRKFFERTGVNPITYFRIVRFNRAYNIKNRFPCLSWLRIAMECNYYDYQHLTKDYKDFTGLSPEIFHEMESNAPESVLGLADEIYKSRCRLSSKY